MKEPGETPNKPMPRVSRRAALGGCALTAVAAGSAYALLRRDPEAAGKPESRVLRGDAPSAEVWSQWQARGWVREALHTLRKGNNVQCQLCPNECELALGDRSRCRNKVNKGGKLYTMAFGNPCSFHVDPIEKKPLYHFLPGGRTFSIATSGCNFRCLNCQNWEISQKKPEQLKSAEGPELRATREVLARLERDDVSRLSMFPDDVVDLAEATGCAAIAYTYSEPISYFEYMLDTARRAKARGIKNLWISNGFIKHKPLLELCSVLDGANVNLKSFSDAIHIELNGGRLQPVLETLRTLKQRHVWFEVTNLVVPTYTDDLQMIRRMCAWVTENLGPEQPLHLSRFHPQHKLDHLSPTPIESLLKARDIAHAEGLKHVYIGNVRGVPEAETTHCANCGKVVVERTIYRVETLRIDRGRCGHCGHAVAGVWSA
jgi:pyruvate formate lyase activating enzyme